jgi:hypothetical protein
MKVNEGQREETEELGNEEEGFIFSQCFVSEVKRKFR